MTGLPHHGGGRRLVASRAHRPRRTPELAIGAIEQHDGTILRRWCLARSPQQVNLHLTICGQSIRSDVVAQQRQSTGEGLIQHDINLRQFARRQPRALQRIRHAIHDQPFEREQPHGEHDQSRNQRATGERHVRLRSTFDAPDGKTQRDQTDCRDQRHGSTRRGRAKTHIDGVAACGHGEGQQAGVRLRRHGDLLSVDTHRPAGEVEAQPARLKRTWRLHFNLGAQRAVGRVQKTRAFRQRGDVEARRFLATHISRRQASVRRMLLNPNREVAAFGIDAHPPFPLEGVDIGHRRIRLRRTEIFWWRCVRPREDDERSEGKPEEIFDF